MLQKALRDEEPVLLHSPSDDGLFDDLHYVAKAVPGIVSKSIAYRGKDDRAEVARILGHLPMVKEARARRLQVFPPRCGTPQSARERPQSRAEERLTPRAAAYMRPPSAGNPARAVKTPTPRLAQTHRTPRASTPKAPRRAWDGLCEERMERPQRCATPSTPTAGPPGQATSVASAQGSVPLVPAVAAELDGKIEAKAEVRAGSAGTAATGPATAAAACPPEANSGGPGQAVAGPVPEAWYQQAIQSGVQSAVGGSRLGFSVLPLDDEVPVVNEKDVEQVQKRYLHKLAEVGVDPKGKKAGEILQTLYARGSRTESQRMNAEAQKKVLVRLRTPLCIKTVLKERALQEVKAARDKPADLVDECLDRWEIETLAEVCRSMKHFDEVAAGHVSTYTRSYGGRQYLGKFDRKKYIRPPTP